MLTHKFISKAIKRQTEIAKFFAFGSIEVDYGFETGVNGEYDICFDALKHYRFEIYLLRFVSIDTARMKARERKS